MSFDLRKFLLENKLTKNSNLEEAREFDVTKTAAYLEASQFVNTPYAQQSGTQDKLITNYKKSKELSANLVRQYNTAKKEGREEDVEIVKELLKALQERRDRLQRGLNRQTSRFSPPDDADFSGASFAPDLTDYQE